MAPYSAQKNIPRVINNQIIFQTKNMNTDDYSQSFERVLHMKLKKIINKFCKRRLNQSMRASVSASYIRFFSVWFA